MAFGRNLVLFLGVCIISLGSSSCGNESGQDNQSKSKAAGDATKAISIGDLAKQAVAPLSIDDEFSEGRKVVEEAGFAVKTYEEFPAQEVAKRGRMLVYEGKRKKHSGGVVYLKKTGAEVAPAWHWYFENMVPDSVIRREVNRDGLWDVRVVFDKGKGVDFTQEDSFTLFAEERSDWIAMNGSSSPPASAEFPMWMCFDGDTTTAWKSRISEGAFIEFAVPFGVKEGLLTVGTLSSEQPDRCVVRADGERLEEVKIPPAAGRHVIALGQAVRGATKVRLEFPSVRGGGEVVAVTELGLK